MKSFLLAFVVAATSLVYGFEYNAVFVEGGWSRKDWKLVASPRWAHEGTWVQKEGYLQNAVPEGVPADVLQAKRAEETYSSMVLANKVKGNGTISCSMSFEYQMAPLIVLAGELTEKDGKMSRYAEHWEIVLFNKGINVWHHEIRDGKPYWRKAAYLMADFNANEKYELVARVTTGGKVPMLEVSCGVHKFGCMLPSFPKEYHVGITGCEGVNRFYDFKVKQ